jgi:hypothetical protein
MMEFVDSPPAMEQLEDGSMWMGPLEDKTGRETGRAGATFYMNTLSMEKVCLRDVAAGDPPPPQPIDGGETGAEAEEPAEISWVRKGALAKVGTGGKIGTVVMDPDRDGDVKMEYEGGESEFVRVETLRELTEADRKKVAKAEEKAAKARAREEEKARAEEEKQRLAAERDQRKQEEAAAKARAKEAKEEAKQLRKQGAKDLQQRCGDPLTSYLFPRLFCLTAGAPPPRRLEAAKRAAETSTLWETFSAQRGLAVRVVSAHGKSAGSPDAVSALASGKCVRGVGGGGA